MPELATGQQRAGAATGLPDQGRQPASPHRLFGAVCCHLRFRSALPISANPASLRKRRRLTDSTGATGAGTQVIGGAAKDIKKASTTYLSMFNPPNAGIADATEAQVQQEMTVAGTLSQLRIRLSAAAGGGTTSYTFNVRRNGVNTGVTCTATGAATSCSDTTNSIAFSAGDRISIQAVPSATPPTDNLEVRWTAKYQP